MDQDSFQPSQPYPPQYPFEEDTVSIIDILLVLARHFKLLVIVPSIFCIVTIIYVLYFTSPIYVSTATFMSSGSGGKQSQMIGLASQFGFSMPRSGAAKWSYMDVIKSRTLARGMLDRKFDTEKYGTQKSLLQILTYGSDEPIVGLDTLINNGIGAVQGIIKVSTSGNMYELEISAFEPKLAADMARAVMEELDKHQRDYNDRKTAETRQFIGERLRATESELEKAEDALKLFRERNRSIFESPQLQLEQERLARDVAVLIGVFTTLKQQLETAKIEEVKESDYIVILDPPEIPIYRSKPNKRLMVIIAGLLGIGLGIVLAFIRGYTQNFDKQLQDKIGEVKALISRNIKELILFKKINNRTQN